MEDEKIITLFEQRSEQALAELDTKYGKVCRSVSHNILYCNEDVEECVNDAYLGVWNAIPPERPDCLLGYLCKIVRNSPVQSDIGKWCLRTPAARCIDTVDK